MTDFELVTLIDAPPLIGYDLSRDVGLHADSMARSGKRAVVEWWRSARIVNN